MVYCLTYIETKRKYDKNMVEFNENKAKVMLKNSVNLFKNYKQKIYYKFKRNHGIKSQFFDRINNSYSQTLFENDKINSMIYEAKADCSKHYMKSKNLLKIIIERMKSKKLVISGFDKVKGVKVVHDYNY